MLCCTKAFLWGCMSLLLAAGVQAQTDACSAGPWVQQTTTVGATHDGGIHFCHSKWNAGLQVVGIEAWTYLYQIKGVQLTYSDGTKDSVGPHDDAGGDGDHVILKWNKDDAITQMQIAPNEDGNGLGHLSFSVGGKDFTISSKHGDIKKVDVGSGILLGAWGQGGGYVYQWTPLFLGTMQGDATVTGMTFDQNLDELNKKQEGMELMSLSEMYIQNSNPNGTNGSDSSYQFAVDLQKKKSVTDSNTKTHTFGVDLKTEFGGKVGIPLVAEGEFKVSIGASYSYQDASTHTSSDDMTATFKFSQGSTSTSDLIKPGHAKHCKAYTWQGHYSGAYTKDIEITVDGQKYSWKQRGTLDTISYSDATGECKDILISDIPSNATQVKEAKSTVRRRRAMHFAA